MKHIINETYDQERALYGSVDILAEHCRFEGPADGESAFKESRSVKTSHCYFDLRYPFWHTKDVTISDCEMTSLCRAALWYAERVSVKDSRLHGIKALRECKEVSLCGSDIVSTEFGWFCQNVKMSDCTVTGEYFMLRSSDLAFYDLKMKGKYSFQYIENCTLENCHLDTKDAFWHAKNVTVRNSLIKGEYLGWYCENVTFENCTIIGTQPLCYCKNLRLINCQMHQADLSFEKSDVYATLTAPIVSIKNPASGRICAPAVSEVIADDPESSCEIAVGGM